MKASLRWQTRAALLAISVCAAVAVVVLVGVPLVWWTMERTAHVFEAVPAQALERCDQDPVSWTYASDRGVTAWALDPTTLEPLRPDAPAVPMMLGLRLAAGEQEPVVLGRSLGGALVVRREGPCAVVMVLWPIDRGAYGWVGALLIGVMVASAALATLVGGWVVLRPLLAALGELDRASRLVGEAGYISAQVPEEMQSVGRALDQAHERVLADRDRLVADRRVLERHIADVAHDLRSPLAALQLRLERLAAHPQDDQAMRGALGDVTYLAMLTDNLALSGQLRSGLLPVEGQVDAGAVAERVAQRFAALGRRLGIEVISAVPDAPVWVPGPALYVEQIFSNLLHNAVRHHDRAGSVVISVEPGVDAVVVEVCDDGPGRPEDLPVERAEATQSHGLGLAIVRQLVQHLGGSIGFEAAIPRGLVVRIQLVNEKHPGPPHPLNG